MDDRLKQRLVGAAVLVVAAIVFVPMLLDQGSGTLEQPPRIIPSQPPQETVTPPVPLDSNATAPTPAPAVPAKPTPAEDKPPIQTVIAPAGGEPSGFAVQLGSFSKAENARGLRDKLVASGYTAFVKTSGSVTRVYVGPHASRAEAEKVLKKLLADTKLKGIVVNYSG